MMTPALLTLGCNSTKELEPDKPLPFPNEDTAPPDDTSDTACIPGECENGIADPNRLDSEEGMCLSFTESAAVLGLTSDVNHARATVVDYDQDGSPDIFLMNDDSPNQLFRNDNGSFTDVSTETGLDFGGDSVGSVWHDSDGDGDLDLLLTGFLGTSLYTNNGGSFGFLTSLDPEPVSYGAVAWLDSGILLATDNGARFYRQEGSNFTSATIEAGLDDPGSGAKIAVADYDGDGWDDVYVANITGRNRLFHNKGDGTYESLEETLGVSENGNDSSTDVEWVGFQGGLLPSLYVANYDAGNQFYINQQNGTFVEDAAELGVRDAGNSVRSAWGDFLGEVSPALFLGRFGEENLFYFPLTEDGVISRYENLAFALGLDESGQTLDAEWLDGEGDGDLDLLIVMFDGAVRLFVNESHTIAQCPE